MKNAHLRDNEVINIKDGYRLGFVCDMEFDVQTGQICSLIVYGKSKFASFGKSDDLVINWCDIEVIGDDTILVNRHHCVQSAKKKGPSFLRSVWN